MLDAGCWILDTRSPHPPESRIQRTARTIEKRQVPLFALLGFLRQSARAFGANNAKGGSSYSGAPTFSEVNNAKGGS